MSSPRLKFNLYLIFKISFFVNLVVASSFTYFACSSHRRVVVLEDSCRKLTCLNADLLSKLSYSVNYITNDIFSVTSSFASNVLLTAASPGSPFSASASVKSSAPDKSISPDIPPLSFSHYCEIDGTPHIYVRRKIYKVGDMLLGFPVQHISPDVVQYRDKFFKVDGDLIK